jgi:hypothetical protein
MTGPVYVKLLDNELRPSIAKLFGHNNMIFQQDNDPKHTSKVARDYFEAYDYNVLEWRNQSPDLNPIQNLWSILDQKLMHRRPNTEEQLFDLIKTQWNNLSVDILNTLVESMPNRCQAVIDARGFMKKY